LERYWIPVAVLFVLVFLPIGGCEPDKLMVGFITAHTSASLEDASEIGYSELANFLTPYFDVTQIQGPEITPEGLGEYVACILFSPETQLAPEEVQAIHAYVEAGGGFLVTSRGWANELLPHVDSITEEWGFRFVNTKVYEPEVAMTDYGVSVSQYTVAALGTIQTNPIGAKFAYPYIMRNSCTINITDPAKIMPAVTLTDYAFGEHYRHQDLKPNAQHGEVVAEDAVVMVNGRIGSGRVVGMGGHELYMNKWMNQSEPAQNPESMMFALEWLTETTGTVPETNPLLAMAALAMFTLIIRRRVTEASLSPSSVTVKESCGRPRL
jgi:hypothetical protein